MANLQPLANDLSSLDNYKDIVDAAPKGNVTIMISIFMLGLCVCCITGMTAGSLIGIICAITNCILTTKLSRNLSGLFVSTGATLFVHNINYLEKTVAL